MTDERTNSFLTWFNSALRGNQTVETLTDMIQIGQWYGKHQVTIIVSPAATLIHIYLLTP